MMKPVITCCVVSVLISPRMRMRSRMVCANVVEDLGEVTAGRLLDQHGRDHDVEVGAAAALGQVEQRLVRRWSQR